MKKQPLVSIVMPVYNGEGFLKEAIESIINQTYKNWELIIVDDASTDNSLKIVSKFKKLYPRKIRLIRMKTNLNKGGDSCANKGIIRAKGKYIARMDSDDVAYPFRLEKQVQFLETHSHIFMAGSFVEVIDKKGTQIGVKRFPLNSNKMHQECLVFQPFSHPSIMFRNKVVKRKNFYKIKFSSNNDFYTFFELLEKGYQCATIPYPLLQYRIHLENDSLKNIKRSFINTLRARIAIIGKYHYPLNFFQVIINIIQTIIVLVFPEKITLYLYLFVKGILTKNNILDKITSFLNLRLFKHTSFLQTKKT